MDFSLEMMDFVYKTTNWQGGLQLSHAATENGATKTIQKWRGIRELFQLNAASSFCVRGCLWEIACEETKVHELFIKMMGFVLKWWIFHSKWAEASEPGWRELQCQNGIGLNSTWCQVRFPIDLQWDSIEKWSFSTEIFYLGNALMTIQERIVIWKWRRMEMRMTEMMIEKWGLSIEIFDRKLIGNDDDSGSCVFFTEGCVHRLN